MNDKEKNEFENKLNSAISASFNQVAASDDLRERIFGRLREEAAGAPPAGLTEEISAQFDERFSQAIYKSQDFSPEDELVLRTEARVSQEMGKNILSERSAQALLSGHSAPQELSELPLDAQKIRFLESLRAEVKRSTGELTAPQELRNRISSALENEAPNKQNEPGKILAFPSRAQWKRGLSALTSLAAGFAILFVGLFGSADAALANSIQWDHENCCRAVMAIQGKEAPSEVQAMLDSEYGAVPLPPVDASWALRLSNMCHSEEGKPMVHLLYSRVKADGNLETMSFHFIPEQSMSKKNLDLSEDKVKDLSKDKFSVLAWVEGDWICAASSPDLDAQSLQAETKAL